MSSSLRTYKRLLGFTRPYVLRLAIGIGAGFLVGGSLLGVFHYSEDLLRPFDRAQTTVAVVDGVAAAPAASRLPLSADGWQAQLADRFGIEMTTPDGRMTGAFLAITILALPLFIGLKALATYVNHYYMQWVGSRVIRDLRDGMFANLQRQSLGFYGRCDVGSLISRCTNDAAMVEKAVSQTIADLTRCPIEVAVCLAFIVYKAYQSNLTGVLPGLLILFPLIILPIVVLGRYIKGLTRQALQQISTLTSRMQETFSGIRVVKAFHMEMSELARFQEVNRRYFKSIVRAFRAELLMNPMMELVAVVAICIGAVLCYQRDVLLTDIGPVALAAVTAYRPFKQLAKVNAGIQRSTAAAERIFELLDADNWLPEAADPRRVGEFTDSIRFADVSFQYQPQDPQILTDINFELKRGQVIAFVGETGSGKTTIANLLARFYDPTSGQILLDGLDLRQIETAALRRLIGIVTQETILFNDTIANNIAYGSPTASHEAIVAAAKQANAHEFILENAEGYQRVIGEKGFVLSGGQRQRLAIARAILRNPPILILDEATSALDTVTERLVQEALNRLMANRTVFAIAHRLSTIKHADQICVLDKGRIVEIGTHEELFQKNGVYRHLCDIQFA